MEVLYFFFFFFQAEDGIRDLYVTGVQTCALPIFGLTSGRAASVPSFPVSAERKTTMEMTVTEIGAVVVAELRAAVYLESTIGQYAKTIKALSEYAGSGGVYSPELGAEFALRTISPRTGRFSPQRRLDYRRLTGVFDSYVRTGRVDLSVRGRGGGGPRPACAALAALDAGWEADMAGRGLAEIGRAH